MRLYLGKSLRHRYYSPSLVHLCPPISYASIGGIRQLIVKIPRTDVILIGYWMAGQVRTMMGGVI